MTFVIYDIFINTFRFAIQCTNGIFRNFLGWIVEKEGFGGIEGSREGSRNRGAVSRARRQLFEKLQASMYWNGEFLAACTPIERLKTNFGQTTNQS